MFAVIMLNFTRMCQIMLLCVQKMHTKMQTVKTDQTAPRGEV